MKPMIHGDVGSSKPAERELQVSFEFFPPHTSEMDVKLWQTIERLAPLGPRFVSVTYGAGGSTRERTHLTLERLLAETDLEPAAHLTCVAASREEVDSVIRRYRDRGIRHIVALRGDRPETAAAGTSGGNAHTPASSPVPEYANALELVEAIRRIAPEIEITVAAYPEGHPEARSAQADLDFLRRKLDAGATRAITQFFFDTDVYLRFVDRAAAAGIDVPIVPGILPVTNFATVRRFAESCGASVPDWLADTFSGLDDDPKTRQLVAASVAIEQCTRLRDAGVSEFHFYTLNRAELTRSICHMLDVAPRNRVGLARQACAT